MRCLPARGPGISQSRNHVCIASSLAGATFAWPCDLGFVGLPLKSVAYHARQCLGFLNPALDRIEARYFVDMFLLAVNRRKFFVEMISSPLRQFFDRVYSGGSEKLSVLPADSLHSKEIGFIDPF